MKSIFILLIAAVSILASCSKSYTCTCTESYDGANKSYSLESNEEIEGLKKLDAEQKCTQGNTGPQTMLGETWGIRCELK